MYYHFFLLLFYFFYKGQGHVLLPAMADVITIITVVASTRSPRNTKSTKTTVVGVETEVAVEIVTENTERRDANKVKNAIVKLLANVVADLAVIELLNHGAGIKEEGELTGS